METVVSEQKHKAQSIKHKKIEPVKLSSVRSADSNKRISTGIGELDRVLGGGTLFGMVALVAGEPGIGKSTLLLQLASRHPSHVLYIAGEESASQIANRASRLGVKGDNIEVLEETDVDGILEQVNKLLSYKVTESEEKNSITQLLSNSISLVIVDSIQTLTTQDLTGTAGSIGQVRECANRLISFAKRTGTPLFLVGHVTKDGVIAGPRVLEHMVDTVLWFEGERTQELRVLRAVKNRFGSTDEVGIFSMREKGLFEVSNPSSLFLGEGNAAGSATTVILEGTRPFLVEIQALVVPTKLAFPKRSASGVDPRRLEMIIAVLARRTGIPLWEHDVFVNVAGGIRVAETAADLAVALSIASAFYDKALKSKSVAVGEVSLLGGIRDVPYIEKRTREAKRLGFTDAVTHKEARTVGEAIRKFISR